MARTVTVRRGGKLPENMAAPYVEVAILEQVIATLKPGDVLPPNCERGAITVEVRDDPPQAYLIVPCEPGKGTHRINYCGDVIYTATPEDPHKQIPCALTLEDLQTLKNLADRQCVRRDALSQAQQRLSATIAAWAAVPQPKENNNV